MGLSFSSVTSLNETLEYIENEFNEMMESRYAPIGRRQRFLADKISGVGQSAAERIGTAGQTAAGKIETARQNVAGRIENVQETMNEKIEDTASYMDLIRRRAAQLSRHQSKALMNIEVFSATGHKYVGEKMKEILVSKLPRRVKKNDVPLETGQEAPQSPDPETDNEVRQEADRFSREQD
jgi:hypothetical protein